jgi:hypothetical protein
MCVVCEGSSDCTSGVASLAGTDGTLGGGKPSMVTA